MGSWLIWLSLVGLSALVLLTTTANLALRLLSLARLAEKMGLRGRKDELDSLLEHRGQLVLATATLRAAAAVGLALVMVRLLAGPESPVTVSLLLISFLLALMVTLVFGVAIPNVWAKYGGESLLIFSLPLLHVLRMLLWPLLFPLSGIDWLGRRLAGVDTNGDDDLTVDLEQEILKVVSEGEARGAVDEEEKEMIESIIELRDTCVHEIMTPRTDITAVDKHITFNELKEIIRDKGHSRIPVFDDTVDDILGVVYAKDLLQVVDNGDFNVAAIMREAIYIPESKPLRSLLHEFQAGKGHMAIVLDEYGGTAGLVTIEDILEELVGEIVDEYEAAEPEPLVHIDDTTVDVDARMSIDDINDELGISLPESEDYETIGGFVFSSLGTIPQAGAECEHDNIRIRVTEAEPRRINRVRLHIDTAAAGDNGSQRG